MGEARTLVSLADRNSGKVGGSDARLHLTLKLLRLLRPITYTVQESAVTQSTALPRLLFSCLGPRGAASGPALGQAPALLLPSGDTSYNNINLAPPPTLPSEHQQKSWTILMAAPAGLNAARSMVSATLRCAWKLHVPNDFDERCT